MELVKLGKKGQLSIPKKVMTDLGLEGDSVLLVETTEDGAIVLRPAAVSPIEMYSDERIQEFLRATDIPDELNDKVEAKLAALRARRPG
jgi:AbrB family looped-hinge helix DNA binding protein